MSRVSRALVVDDEEYVRESVSRLLTVEGWRTDTASGVTEALSRLASLRVDAVVSDLRMPGGDVFALLEGLAARGDRTPVVVITGVGTVREAVRAMKAGAFDFLQKPVDPEELLLIASRAAEHRRLVAAFEDLRAADEQRRRRRVLVGSSPAMARVREAVARCAAGASNVLVTGETGSGKGLVAERLHDAGDPDGVLVHLRCAGATAEDVEREFTSSSPRGARLAEQGGTVLLDEVGLLPPGAQERVLAVLESEREGPPVRFVATTNADLERAVREGSLRADLFWRLHALGIAVPPLRDHLEDLPELVAHFLGDAPPPTGEALEVLASYAWPGNVRELQNVVERARLVAGDEPLDAAVLRSVLEPSFAPAATVARPGGGLQLRSNLDALERDLLLRALAQSEGLKKHAAYQLGIDPRNLGYYLRKHGLGESDRREGAGG